MTARKHATTSPAPRITSGPDEIRVPCAGQTHVYDQLIDGMVWAVPAAKEICAGCPIRDACWTENADEMWVQVLTGKRTNTRTKYTETHDYYGGIECGTNRGYDWHRKKMGEPACDECKAAHATHTRESARRKKAERAAAAAEAAA